VEDVVFYKNINNLRYALNSAFDVLQNQQYQSSEVLFGDAISDDCWTMQDVTAGNVSDIVNFTFNTDNPYILSRYQINYRGINIVNQIIRSIPYVDYDTALVQNQREIRMVYGQAKLLRALFYFNLVKTFGGVSIQPETQELGSLVVPRSTLDETYAYIEKDLRESILLLEKNRYQTSQAGQIDAGGGLGLLMKVLLYEASSGVPTKTIDKAAKMKEAVEIGKYFIDGKDISVNDLIKFDANYSGTETWDEFAQRMVLPKDMTKSTVLSGVNVCNTHGLYAFDKLFRVSGEFSEEPLIEINQYDYSGSGSTVDEKWRLNGYINDQSQTSDLYVVPTKDLLDQFANDPRQMFTIGDRNINEYFKLDNGVSFEVSGWWYGVGDMLQFTKYFTTTSEGGAGMRNYVIMRYAEALLIYAEALNETGDTEHAVEMVNKVRARAQKLFTSETTAKYQKVSASNFKLLSLAPQDIIRNAILKEKRIEMAGEFDRWFEICRLGTVSQRMEYMKNHEVSDAAGGTRHRGTYFRKGVNEIFPIPQKEVYISNGIIKQNFGY
jgi:hypothetical protein